MLTIDSAFSLSSGAKSGGGGKADIDGTVDTDDAVCEVTRERPSSVIVYDLGELKKPRTGDWYGDGGSAVLFMEKAGGVPSGSVSAGQALRGGGLSETGRR